MRTRLRIVAFLGLLALPPGVATGQQSSAPPSSPPAPQQQGEPKVGVTTALVRLVASVTDRRHKFITDLDKGDFRVLEDGKPQDIAFFSRQTDLPLRIAMLLDTSNSIRERLRFEQDAAIDFLDNVIRRNKDMAFLMTFDNEPEVIQDYTGDLAELTKAIQKQRAGGGTALRDAVFQASEKLVNAPLAGGPNPQVRRVLVVISDGDDNLSDRALSDAMEMAQRAEAVIYAISTNTDWLAVTGETPHKSFKTHGDQVLEQFSVETGGRVFFPYKIDDLAVSFQDIGSELRSQYLIAYRPAGTVTTGGFRKVHVDVGRKGLTVRTRRGYYAPRSSADAARPAAPPSSQ